MLPLSLSGAAAKFSTYFFRIIERTFHSDMLTASRIKIGKFQPILQASKCGLCAFVACRDWKLCHSTCTNENLGAHIFVQEVLGAHVKQTKIKLYMSGFQVLWSIMT